MYIVCIYIYIYIYIYTYISVCVFMPVFVTFVPYTTVEPHLQRPKFCVQGLLRGHHGYNVWLVVDLPF